MVYSQTSSLADKVNFIWQVVSDILRDNVLNHQYSDLIIPFVVLRRLDCLLEPTKDAIISVLQAKAGTTIDDELHAALLKITAPVGLYNASPFTFRTLLQQPNEIEQNFLAFMDGFSEPAASIFQRYVALLMRELRRSLEGKTFLYGLISKFAELDLGRDALTNDEMVTLIEELLRGFAELSPASTYNEYFTPREIIQLIIRLLLTGISHIPTTGEQPINVLDPTAGTGGILNAAKAELIRRLPNRQIATYGQDINLDVATIAQLIRLVSNDQPENYVTGNTLTHDMFSRQRFQFIASNPPFGLSWSHIYSAVEEANKVSGRFPAGLPRSSDATWLFIQHMLSKMSPSGSRVAALTTARPWSIGDASSAESGIRRWVIENDLLEAIVALPPNQFYHTGVSTYLCIFTNCKPKKRKGKVQLINATEIYEKMEIGTGRKRHYISPDQIDTIERIYLAFAETENSFILRNHQLGYQEITYRRTCYKWDNNRQAETENIRESEQIPLPADAKPYFTRMIQPRYEWAELDEREPQIGYEIAFNRIFEKKRIKAMASEAGLEPVLLRDIAEIDSTRTEFEDRPNAVYLPRGGYGNAVAYLSDIKGKHQNFFQIVLDESSAIADYVAHYFTSPLGRLIRQQASVSVAMAQLNRRTLHNAKLYLPSRRVQLETLSVSLELRALLTELQGLDSRLWSSTKNLTGVATRVKAFSSVADENARFVTWIDSLPFPLSSILWTYHAASDDDKASVEHLLHFFEATAQFCATLLLSVLKNDSHLFQQELPVLSKALKMTPLTHASFGTWKNIASRLTSVLRRLLEKERTRCAVMFRTDNDRVMGLFTSTDLVAMIEKTNSLRNVWRHGGYVSAEEAQTRHEALRDQLLSARAILGNIWEDYVLIQPLHNQFRQGIYTYQAKKIVGNRVPFQTVEYRIEHALEYRELHFVSPTENRALQLLPLVKIMPSPETKQDACYFYNRVNEGGDLRFVSYHYGSDADISGPHEDTRAFLELFQLTSNNDD